MTSFLDIVWGRIDAAMHRLGYERVAVAQAQNTTITAKNPLTQTSQAPSCALHGTMAIMYNGECTICVATAKAKQAVNETGYKAGELLKSWRTKLQPTDSIYFESPAPIVRANTPPSVKVSAQVRAGADLLCGLVQNQMRADSAHLLLEPTPPNHRDLFDDVEVVQIVSENEVDHPTLIIPECDHAEAIFYAVMMGKTAQLQPVQVVQEPVPPDGWLL